MKNMIMSLVVLMTIFIISCGPGNGGNSDTDQDLIVTETENGFDGDIIDPCATLNTKEEIESYLGKQLAYRKLLPGKDTIVKIDNTDSPYHGAYVKAPGISVKKEGYLIVKAAIVSGMKLPKNCSSLQGLDGFDINAVDLNQFFVEDPETPGSCILNTFQLDTEKARSEVFFPKHGVIFYRDRVEKSWVTPDFESTSVTNFTYELLKNGVRGKLPHYSLYVVLDHKPELALSHKVNPDTSVTLYIKGSLDEQHSELKDETGDPQKRSLVSDLMTLTSNEVVLTQDDKDLSVWHTEPLGSGPHNLELFLNGLNHSDQHDDFTQEIVEIVIPEADSDPEPDSDIVEPDSTIDEESDSLIDEDVVSDVEPDVEVDTEPVPVCGNDLLEDGEECDTSETSQEDCSSDISNGFGEKTKSCVDCSWAYSQCVATKCSDGYELKDGQCVDIDECSTGNNNCDSNAACTDTPGSFTCECTTGYEGDGKICTDTNACKDNPCYAGVECTDQPAPSTGFTCGSCPSGYEGDGITCTDINECTDGSNNCDTNAACGNTDGSFTCTCNTGYTGDGITCDDTDACASNPCFAEVTCTDEAAPATGFTCGACPDGYTGDGITCTKDIDLCDGVTCNNGGTCNTGSGACECTNQWGGDSCDTCPSNFTGAACDQCASGYGNYPSCLLLPALGEFVIDDKESPGYYAAPFNYPIEITVQNAETYTVELKVIDGLSGSNPGTIDDPDAGTVGTDGKINFTWKTVQGGLDVKIIVVATGPGGSFTKETTEKVW